MTPFRYTPSSDGSSLIKHINRVSDRVVVSRVRSFRVRSCFTFSYAFTRSCRDHVRAHLRVTLLVSRAGHAGFGRGGGVRERIKEGK